MEGTSFMEMKVWEWGGGSLRTGFPFPNYSDGGGTLHLVAGASRRPISLLRSSKPGAWLVGGWRVQREALSW